MENSASSENMESPVSPVNGGALPADGIARRIVRHFQEEGFTGVSEALIIRIRVRQGDRETIDAAFEQAMEQDKLPPLQEHFELHSFGHFSDQRSYAAAKAALQSDFSASLRMEIPGLYFNPAPVLIDDAFATGSRYDAMVKLNDNIDGYAFAVLLNDPDSSFLEYLGTHHGSDWKKIMDDFSATALALDLDSDLI